MQLRRYLRELGRDLADPKVGIYFGLGVYGILPLFTPEPPPEHTTPGHAEKEPPQAIAAIHNQTNVITKTPPTRSWLPKPGIKKYINNALFMVIGAFVFTSLITLAVAQIQANSLSGWFVVVLQFLTNTIFGLLLQNWWEQSRSEDPNYEAARQIDERVENEILQVSEHWQNTIHTLRTLARKQSQDFLEAAEYFLGYQQNAVESSIKRWAAEVARLGFNTEAFLAEKMTKLQIITQGAHDFLNTIKQETRSSPVRDAYSGATETTQFAPPQPAEKSEPLQAQVKTEFVSNPYRARGFDIA